MFFENKNLIQSLRKKYTKEKLIIFTGSHRKTVKKFSGVIRRILKIMSKELNYDLYIFDSANDKALSKYGTVIRYDKSCVKAAIYKIEDLVDTGCKRAFVLNTDLIDKRLYNENLNYRFLFFTNIEDICIPESQPKSEVKIGGAELFNFVRDIEALNTEKICYCKKECFKVFNENQFKHMERLSSFKFEKDDLHKHIRALDCLLDN